MALIVIAQSQKRQGQGGAEKGAGDDYMLVAGVELTDTTLIHFFLKFKLNKKLFA